MGLGPSQQYLAKYNSYILPGYVQEESFDSVANIAEHYGTYADGSLSEYTGLQNKELNLSLKVWEQDYAAAKEAVQEAASMLRSNRENFAPLYLQNDDTYYEALVKSIRIQKQAGTPVRLLQYDISFECKPWLYGTELHAMTGTGDTIDTDQEGRTIDNGGFTPATLVITGTNPTVSGYCDDGTFTGYLSATGSVSNLTIDSDNMTATHGGENYNHNMLSADYRIYIGPGRTNFALSNVTSISISYYDRWNL